MDTAANLQRFVDAQGPVLEQVMAELAAGRKASHWMWFIFPQLKALGRSATAKFYGIESLAEARAYAVHPILGDRLVACTHAVCRHGDKSLHAIFGSPDDLKFRSCMTLFSRATPEIPAFREALERFREQEDTLTIAALQAAASSHRD